MNTIRTIAIAATLVASGLSAQAHEEFYKVVLTGPAEAPPNASPGQGVGLVTFDLDLATMRVQVSFADLTGNVTASHIHCCTASPGSATAGVATQLPSFVGFPHGGTSGSYDHTFDLTVASSYNPAFVTAQGSISGAMNALLAGALAGTAYLNIHTETFRAGEIRGFLQPVPEPSTWALMALGLVATGFAARRRAA